jgi:hypothetical protein
MTAPIIASFRWSKDEFLRAQRLAVRHFPQGRMILRVTRVIGTLILLCGVFNFYRHTVGWFGFCYIMLFALFFFSMPFFTRRAALKLYAQKPDRDMEVKFEISEERVRMGSELASAENSWELFQRIIRGHDGFLIYQSGNLFHWLPLHAFQSADDIERFADLARTKVKDYEDNV